MIAERLEARPALAVWQLAGVALVMTAGTLAVPAIQSGPGGWILLFAFLGSSLCCLLAWRLIGSVDPRVGLPIILISALLIRIGFLFVDPQLSTDIYRYIWDGRVIAHGINPYRFVPAATELQSFRDPHIWALINRADYAVTIYPPVAQLFFWLVTRLGESVAVMKMGLIACEAGTVYCLLRILVRQGQSPLRVVAYAWHPLPIWEIAGNGHVDAAMIALLMVALLLFLEGKVLLAGIAVTLGALVKPTALLALPMFWRPWNWRLPLVVFATMALAYLPFLSVGKKVLGFVPEYIEEEGLRSGQGFRLLAMVQERIGIIPHGATAYLIIAAAILATMALATGFRKDRSDEASIRSLGWLLVAFLILSSPHYPWYLMVLVPFLVIAPSWTGWALTVSVVILYCGSGTDYGARNIAFSVITFVALAIDLSRYSGKSALDKRMGALA